MGVENSQFEHGFPREIIGGKNGDHSFEDSNDYTHEVALQRAKQTLEGYTPSEKEGVKIMRELLGIKREIIKLLDRNNLPGESIFRQSEIQEGIDEIHHRLGELLLGHKGEKSESYIRNSDMKRIAFLLDREEGLEK